nr:HYP [Psychrobacter sp.]
MKYFKNDSGDGGKIWAAILLFIGFSATVPNLTYFLLFLISMTSFYQLYLVLVVDKNYSREDIKVFFLVQLLIIVLTLVNYFVSSHVHIGSSRTGYL